MSWDERGECRTPAGRRLPWLSDGKPAKRDIDAMRDACLRCPVLSNCREEADRMERREDHIVGFLAAMTQAERRKIKRRGGSYGA